MLFVGDSLFGVDLTLFLFGLIGVVPFLDDGIYRKEFPTLVNS